MQYFMGYIKTLININDVTDLHDFAVKALDLVNRVTTTVKKGVHVN